MRARSFWVCLVSLVALAQPARAEDLAMKNATVAGTVGTWAYALIAGAELFNCEKETFLLRASTGKDDEIRTTSVGIGGNECTLKRGETWSLTYVPMVLVTHWKADSSSLFKTSANDIAFVPMLRWKILGLSSSIAMDLELGIGPAWLSETKIGDREKSTHFQFSDHLGIGISDAKGVWRVSFAYRHVSNADIKSPNNAVDFKGMSLEWRFK